MIISDFSVTFSPAKFLKHSKKGKTLDTFHYRAYNKEKILCVVEVCKEYLKRRSLIYVTFAHQLEQALQRYIGGYYQEVDKDLFTECKNFDFSAHSCRSASTSKAKEFGVEVERIIKKVCRKNSKTFYMHYQKEIVVEEHVDFNVLLAMINIISKICTCVYRLSCKLIYLYVFNFQ